MILVIAFHRPGPQRHHARKSHLTKLKRSIQKNQHHSYNTHDRQLFRLLPALQVAQDKRARTVARGENGEAAAVSELKLQPPYSGLRAAVPDEFGCVFTLRIVYTRTSGCQFSR